MSYMRTFEHRPSCNRGNDYDVVSTIAKDGHLRPLAGAGISWLLWNRSDTPHDQEANQSVVHNDLL